MSTCRELRESISSTIADYRAGEGLDMGTDHIRTWVRQFEKAVREPLLAELDHVLKKTYISKDDADKFLSRLVNNKKLAGERPCDFWSEVSFLDIQQGGQSQKEMLQVFNEALQKECDLELAECGEGNLVFLYLDDVIFSGNRVKNDLAAWIKSDCPKKAQVHVVTMAFHRLGQYYADKGISDAATAAGKQVVTKWWRSLELENRLKYRDNSDVLWPSSLPKDKLVQGYVNAMQHQPILRTPGSVGENKFFSSETNRHALEQELLVAGVKIRSVCPDLIDYQRPLGNSVLETLGFGSLIVTFRNCANNCPLAFWAGDPWYPLFPRKTN